MAILGQIGTSGANTEFLSMATDIFNGKREDTWTMFAEQISLSGQNMELDAVGPSPVVRQMTTSQRFGNLREYALRTPVATYRADALELKRTVVENDKTGMVQRRMSQYLALAGTFFEKPVVDKFLANPTGIDGVSILNDSHPYGPAGATWDNKTTDALSQTSLEAGIVAMRSLRLENGEPAGYFPTDLVVGPALEREALDLVGESRMLPVSNAGAPDASANVVAAVMIRNWIGGRLRVTVIDRFANGTNDNDWYIMDLSKPGIRPMAVGVAIAPQGVAIVSPESESMKYRDSYSYYVTANAAISGYAPQCIYGKNA